MEIDNLCAYGESFEANKHPYLLRCTMPSEHGGRHVLAPAHRVQWEAIHGTPAPAKVAHLRPVDGDWCNLEPSNWELVSFSKSRKERRALPEQADGKHCRDCGMFKALTLFAARRNVCAECWKERLRVNAHKRYVHVRDFNCHLVDGRHFHVLDKESAREYGLYLYYRELRKEHPDQDQYRLAVTHARAKLHRAVESARTTKEAYSE